MTEETYKALSETTIEAVHIVDEPDELVTYIVEVVDYILSSVDVVGTAKAVTKRGNGSELDDEQHIRG